MLLLFVNMYIVLVYFQSNKQIGLMSQYIDFLLSNVD